MRFAGLTTSYVCLVQDFIGRGGAPEIEIDGGSAHQVPDLAAMAFLLNLSACDRWLPLASVKPVFLTNSV